MAYDAVLADRIRAALAGHPAAPLAVTEKAMFGGLAFLVGGHLAVSASGRGGLMVRCRPSATDELLDPPRVTRMVMRGREMDGWLRVSEDAVADDGELTSWVARGVSAAH